MNFRIYCDFFTCPPEVNAFWNKLAFWKVRRVRTEVATRMTEPSYVVISSRRFAFQMVWSLCRKFCQPVIDWNDKNVTTSWDQLHDNIQGKLSPWTEKNVPQFYDAIIPTNSYLSVWLFDNYYHYSNIQIKRYNLQFNGSSHFNI